MDNKYVYIVTVVGPVRSAPKIVGAYSSRESAQKAIEEAKRLDREIIGDDYAEILYIYDITRVPIAD